MASKKTTKKKSAKAQRSGGKTLAIARVSRDGGTQSRAGLNDQVVAEYAEIVEEDPKKLPPIVVFYDGEKYWVGDGFHRVEAHIAAGKDMIVADIRQGTREDAIWYSCGANQAHGLRRTNADKRRAVEQALRLKPKLSDRAVAEHVGVSHTFVAKLRQVATDATSSTRTGADGKTYDTEAIAEANRRRAEEQRRERERQRPPTPRVDTSTSQAGPDDDDEVVRDDEGGGPVTTGTLASGTFTPRLEQEEPDPGGTASEEEEEDDAAAAAPAAAPPTDEDGRVVPDDMRAAWTPLRAAAHDVSQHVVAAERDLTAFDGMLEQLMVGGVPQARLGRVRAAAKDIRARLHQLGWEVRQLAPHVVCSGCEGEGCEKCGRTGWLGRSAEKERQRTDEILGRTGS